jgi:hypothetical protein
MIIALSTGVKMNAANKLLMAIDDELHIERETLKLIEVMKRQGDTDIVYTDWMIRKHQRAVAKLTLMRQDLLAAANRQKEEATDDESNQGVAEFK